MVWYQKLKRAWKRTIGTIRKGVNSKFGQKVLGILDKKIRSYIGSHGDNLAKLAEARFGMYGKYASPYIKEYAKQIGGGGGYLSSLSDVAQHAGYDQTGILGHKREGLPMAAPRIYKKRMVSAEEQINKLATGLANYKKNYSM